MEEMISARQLQRILDAEPNEIIKLCKKARLKAKKDSKGNVYFAKSDVDVLKKVKELYDHTAQIQSQRYEKTQKDRDNFLHRAKERIKSQFTPSMPSSLSSSVPTIPTMPFSSSVPAIPTPPAPQISEHLIISGVNNSLANLESSLLEQFASLLSEKMDGMDEVVVELVRAKTENETMRQQINALNKENFALRQENASYKSIGLGLYMKKNTDDFNL